MLAKPGGSGGGLETYVGMVDQVVADGKVNPL